MPSASCSASLFCVSVTFQKVGELVGQGKVRISDHGYDELANDGLLAKEIVGGVSSGVVIEDYPEYHKGPSVLVLQRDEVGRPVHAVWGIPKGETEPAVLVTAYRPDPSKWTSDFMRRKP